MVIGIMLPRHLDTGCDQGIKVTFFDDHGVTGSGLSLSTETLHKGIGFREAVIGDDVLDVDEGGSSLFKDDMGPRVLKLAA